MAYEYRKLLGRITECCGSQANFAKAMGLSERSISLKLNCKIGFKQDEIRRACEILGVTAMEIPAYFFTMKVQD